MSEHIVELIEDGVQYLRFNRPEKKNAITLDMYQQMSDFLHSAEANDNVRVTLIHGEGEDFTAGNDINEFISIAHSPDKMASTLAFLQILTSYKKPLIAAVEGRAVGIGATMLLHCDLVVAAREAVLKFPFVQLGLVPEAASSHLLPKLVGHQHAFEVLVLGEEISGLEALDYKLVNKVCESGEALDLAKALAHKVATLPREAVILSKDLLKYRGQDDVQMALMREARIFKERLKSREASAAFSAFLSRPKA
ncbi:enoyl-CoA hydratase [Marinomonas mediterranea]|jgi:Enoyl-CoA hydratase (EC 4.2.1.17)|uniref:Enoyl-CoA hydratase/isomerase n=1 Tax=Marinomonas mediterranea (strain ATCC 700492 / JCM 21426 / NBRC 103028 / MMB-1) TaxID=717774 RepID=F2K014_MARM1|nr:enoyl-CoA hydratase-related protein [Marinomonas mediterranea]ADZ92126.1 Enoyl-CoA hydratase/isomerase [Marinomonas mediterranea MMB-1]WCN14136.1 enoyl-CoA hydratase [Marinomonas mediterranea]WCN18191.1 enoyl-CoA hydratase [Marinomonas mediterranea MMB-1]